MSRRWLRMAQTALSLYAQRCRHIIQYSLLGLSLWSLLPLWKRWFLLLLICGSCFLLLHHQSRRQSGVKGNRKEYPGVLRVSSSHRMDFNPSRLQMQFAVSPKGWLRVADQCHIPPGKPRTAAEPRHTTAAPTFTALMDSKVMSKTEKLHSTSQKGRQKNLSVATAKPW